eukprot:g4396.t1
MIKNSIFRRRRANNRTGESPTENLRTEGRVASSPAIPRLPALQENAPITRRDSRFSSVHSTFDSTTSASELKATEKAFAISRALSRNWSGVDDDEEELVPSRVHPSASPFFRNWIEQQQQNLSPRPASRERSSAASANQESTSNESTQVVLWGTWKFASVLFLITCCIAVSIWSGLFCSLSPGLQFCRAMKSSSSLTFSQRHFQKLLFRDRYFKVIIHDDNTGKFGNRFEKGLFVAAEILRVNVSIQRTQNLEQTARQIESASCSLFDGLLVTLPEDPGLSQLIQSSKQRTSIMTIGALESRLTESGHGLGFLGEQEANVGRLAGLKMKEAGMKTSVCLSRADNAASVHRCRGFKQAFGTQTYELNLNTMLQSELKSKLIPTILDDSEINGLFVADPRSFPLVHQILRSLNRLCLNKKAGSNGRCIYFGTYGIDNNILQAVQRREIQFTIDPQEYLHGFLSLTWMMLVSFGSPFPSLNKDSSFQLSRVIDSSEKAQKATVLPNGSAHNIPRFQFVLYGEASYHHIQQLKIGLRNAARDLNVHVEFHHCVTGLESNGCAINAESKDSPSIMLFDGYVFSTSDPTNIHMLDHFDVIVKSSKPYLTLGKHHAFYNTPASVLHIGYRQAESNRTNEVLSEWGNDPALNGYLSVLFLVLNNWYGEMPFGFLNTG